MNQTPFGRMPDGQPVDAYTLTSGPLSCRILTYGGAVQSLTIPDRRGCPVDVVLGFDTLADYRTQDKYMGALAGRYANRIGGSTFMLNGTEYPLPANDGPNHLHGGLLGFDRQLWTVESASENALTLSLTSPDGQEGYPGTLTVQAAYTLQDGALTLDLRARADRDTLCNLTGHTYFNLSGHQSGPVLGQYIQLFADHYTPSGPDSIPTGALAPVADTPMDLRTPQPIGLHINSPFPQPRATTTTGPSAPGIPPFALPPAPGPRTLESCWSSPQPSPAFSSTPAISSPAVPPERGEPPMTTAGASP